MSATVERRFSTTGTHGLEQGTTRLQSAAERLQAAIDRLEAILEERLAGGDSPSGQDGETAQVLQTALQEAEQEKAELQAITEEVSARLDAVIERLQGALEDAG